MEMKSAWSSGNPNEPISSISGDYPDSREAGNIKHREHNLLLHKALPDVESARIFTLPPHPLLLEHESRSRDEIHKPFGGPPDDFGTLGIMREAARIFRRQPDQFISLAYVLVLPLSIIILLHVVFTRPIASWTQTLLEITFYEESLAAGIRTLVTKFVYPRVAAYLVSAGVGAPLAISLAALSKAGVVYTVALTYAGLEVSFVDVFNRVLPRVWLPLVSTYLASCAIFIGTAIAALLCVWVVGGLFVALHAQSALILLVLTVLAVTVCGVFVYLKIVLNVANVICILEHKCGFAALARSFSILQARVRVALGSYLVACLCVGFVTLLFEKRVTNMNYYTEHNSSAVWEGPLLILLHSFLYLFADVMTTVLYFTCPRSEPEPEPEPYEALDASAKVLEGVGSIV